MVTGGVLPRDYSIQLCTLNYMHYLLRHSPCRHIRRCNCHDQEEAERMKTAESLPRSARR